MIDYDSLEDSYDEPEGSSDKKFAPVSTRRDNQYRAECGKNRTEKKLKLIRETIRQNKYGSWSN